MELFSCFKILLKQNDWRIFVVLFAFITFQFSCILKASGSLTNTVETVPLFEALKPYIHSEKAPQIRVDFLNNSLSDAYLFPVYSFQYLFTIMLFESREESIIEILHCLIELVEWKKSRKMLFLKYQGCF